MYLFGLFKTAVRALFTNLGRSLLTILGIVMIDQRLWLMVLS